LRSLYGAGQRTGILQVEKNLAKALGKQEGVLVVNSADRDAVLGEISARIARYEKFDPIRTAELKELREDVRDIFNKGLDPGDDIMEQLYFLDPKTKDLVSRMTAQYNQIVTPQDFKDIAKIMTEYMGEQVPILKTFTRFYGRLAEDFLKNAKPSESAFDWTSVGKTVLFGKEQKGYKVPPLAAQAMGVKANEPVSEKIIKAFTQWDPNGTLYNIIFGTPAPEARKTGFKYFKVEPLGLKKIMEYEFLFANKLPKSWTRVPSVNFDGKVIEQHFTQVFEEKLVYKNADGEWVTNIMQVPQKTEASWWEQLINKSGKINDIADATKARTAFGVNANHSRILL